MVMQQIKILLLDDSQQIYELINNLLNSLNPSMFEVKWCAQFDEALELVKSEIFDVGLIDQLLNDEQNRTGIDWIHAVQGDNIPLATVLITGQSNGDLENKALEVGVTDYLDKTELTARNLNRVIRYSYEHSQTRRKLQNSEARLRSLVDVQTDLICRFLPDTTLTYVNPAYCAYFNRTEAELLGKPFLSLIPKEQHPPIQSHIANLIASGEAITYEHEVMTPNNGLCWQRWTDHIVYDEHGNVAELQSIGTDITELKQTQLHLKDALEKERELSELKSRFISMTSHEFRTPLSSIKAAAEILRDFYDRMDYAERSKRFSRINTQIEHMTMMLDEILMIEELSSNNMALKFELFDIVAFANNIVDDFNLMQDVHEIVYTHPQQSVKVKADKRLVRQIITNLLSNAIKYSTNDGAISLHLESDPTKIHFSVTDTGIGIPQSDIDHIFEPFHRASNVDARKGTGLGLSIVKHAVDKHEGTIEICSTIQKGTTVRVKLPLTT